MMANQVSFIYRLPITYVRVTGTRTQVVDALEAKNSVTCKSVVTTETAADLLTSCEVTLNADALSTQQTTWNLTGDGRLLGADVATTAEPLAAWTASLSAASAVLAAGSPLLAAGPPGWAALGMAAGIVGVATHLKVRGLDAPDDPHPFEGSPALPAPPDNALPSDWGIHSQYASEHASEAIALANYRAALAEAAVKHAQAARASVLAPVPEEQEYWLGQVGYFKRALMMTSIGSAVAEAAYETWKSGKLTTTSLDIDQWLRIDELPTPEELTEWAQDPSPAGSSWHEVANRLGIAISVTLEEILGDNQKLRLQKFEPLASDEKLRHRPPRAATLEVWKLSKQSSGRGFELQRSEVRRMSVAYPGNETVLSIAGERGTKSAVAATFDESGALTKVTTESKDSALQRAHDVGGLQSALSAAAETGNDLRKAFSPPSLVERAAEAKAAQELGLTTSPPDPHKELKNQLAEQQLRAQLNIAQQIASSSSLPVFVTVSD